MLFHELPLLGAYRLELDKKGDERGFFARAFCQREFAEHGLNANLAQANVSFSAQVGTLRGLHYQLPPHAENKIVRCTRGRLWDVLVDIRPDSPTFGQWHGEELTPDNRTILYVPEGFAHGFITLEPDTEIFYLVTAFYAPEHERGIRWNDPKFAIEWPREPAVLSNRDQQHPDFDPRFHLSGGSAQS
ncbi:MAG: dTDP-4-dehydrorhamnose 3,5-epimerase [Opitutales bacterium]